MTAGPTPAAAASFTAVADPSCKAGSIETNPAAANASVERLPGARSLFPYNQRRGRQRRGRNRPAPTAGPCMVGGNDDDQLIVPDLPARQASRPAR